jgi:hypothetical protein
VMELEGSGLELRGSREGRRPYPSNGFIKSIETPAGEGAGV